MNGKIIKYIEEKGYGFILDENGFKRFFHISDTLSPLDIKIHQMVEFEPDENEKGLISKEIQIVHTKHNTKFITINNTNIKCSNIKQFGISSGTDVFYKRIIKSFFGFTEEKVEILKYEDLPELNIEIDDVFTLPGKDTKGYTKIEEPYDYLYITTYQGNNHKFRGNKEELEEKIKYIKETLN
ncbi:cold-shock protein [Aliarcobacter thereius]|uniref:cold-shock protein n=1 Tax=Aliarcobacter thereius TaxID=544718 RepID=UPI000824814F|nr:cold shock domain-containing protein [Aliarcobacter thereius]OCL90514.1 Cold-shock DNA-binding domain protein [Aliarcobacter thereius]